MNGIAAVLPYMIEQGHCHIAPYWFDVMEKDEVLAYQASSRGGTLFCRREGDRVILGGHAVLFEKGQLAV